MEIYIYIFLYIYVYIYIYMYITHCLQGIAIYPSWPPMRSLGEPNTWVLWTDLDGADFFWTSSNCSTTVVPDSGIVGNTPAVAPSNGGISDAGATGRRMWKMAMFDERRVDEGCR